MALHIQCNGLYNMVMPQQNVANIMQTATRIYIIKILCSCKEAHQQLQNYNMCGCILQ